MVTVIEITCDNRTLHQLRPNELASRLSGVSTVRPFVQPTPRPYEFVLAARHGPRPSGPERDWRFPSSVRSIHCRYIEIWLPVDALDRSFRLRHAYFHLDHHQGPDTPPKEILAFHWEPLAEMEVEGASEYPCRPHLHITSAPEPLGHAHFGATLTVNDDNQSNSTYLNELLDEVFKMIQVEVLDRINADPNGFG